MDNMKTHGKNGADDTATPADQRGDIPQASGSEGATRRRLLKGGLIGAPVILTQYGRPAWAGGCSESAMASENMSDVVDCEGEGCSKGFWKKNTHLWHPQYGPDKEFSEIFLITAFYAKNSHMGATLEEVIRGDCTPVVPANCDGNCDRQLRGLGRQAVAALQNAACDVKYDLDVLTVIGKFVQAYQSPSADAIQHVKNELYYYNNQYCPLDSHGYYDS